MAAWPVSPVGVLTSLPLRRCRLPNAKRTQVLEQRHHSIARTTACSAVLGTPSPTVEIIPCAAERLALLRIAVFGLGAAHIATTPFEILTSLPSGMRRAPRLLAMLTPEMWTILMQPFVLQCVRWSSAAVLLAATLGMRPWSWIGPVAAVHLLLYESNVNSFGHRDEQYCAGD